MRNQEGSLRKVKKLCGIWRERHASGKSTRIVRGRWTVLPNEKEELILSGYVKIRQMGSYKIKQINREEIKVDSAAVKVLWLRCGAGLKVFRNASEA